MTGRIIIDLTIFLGGIATLVAYLVNFKQNFIVNTIISIMISFNIAEKDDQGYLKLYISLILVICI